MPLQQNSLFGLLRLGLYVTILLGEQHLSDNYFLGEQRKLLQSYSDSTPLIFVSELAIYLLILFLIFIPHYKSNKASFLSNIINGICIK